MTPEERAALETELADLERMLDKRRDEPGYAANVIAIEKRITEIRRELNFSA